MTTGVLAFLSTARGELRSAGLAVVTGLLAVFLVTWAMALALDVGLVLLRKPGKLTDEEYETRGIAGSS